MQTAPPLIISNRASRGIAGQDAEEKDDDLSCGIFLPGPGRYKFFKDLSESPGGPANQFSRESFRRSVLVDTEVKNAAKDEEKKSFVASFKVNHVDIGVAADQWRSRRIDLPTEQPLSLMNGIYAVYNFLFPPLVYDY